jgi:hypothetical protein
MMKEILVKLFVGFILLTLVTIGIFKCTSKEYEERDKLLDNGIVFSGKVIDTKISNNGNFGIAVIKLDSSNVKEYAKFSDEYLFPYRIKDSIAEIYCYLPRYSKVDKIKLISKDRMIYFYNKDKIKFNSTSLFINTSERNLKYVKKHTIFKD